MSDERADPSGTTDQFRAFVQSQPQQPAQRGRAALLAGIAAAAVVVAVVVYLAVR